MAIRSSDQVSLVDVTDAYSVILTSEAHTFIGGVDTALAGSATTQIVAMRGAEQVPASVTVSEITKPSGVTVSSDGKSPAPTLTISVDTSVTAGGIVKIPVHISDITIYKEFSFAIAFKGTNGTSVTVSNTSVTYAQSTTTTQPTSGWNPAMPSVPEGNYLWTRTVVTYSDGKSTTTYSYAKQGKGGTNGTDGTSVTVSGTEVTYAQSTTTTQPTSGWSSAMPSVPEGSYLWTKTVVTYSDGKSTTTYSYAKQGVQGDPGADAISLSITSSNGTIFKNSAISTVLTAHIYKAGAELSASQIAALGTIKWYKDGGTTAVATGQTLTIDAGDITNKATYIAQLEG